MILVSFSGADNDYLNFNKIEILKEKFKTAVITVNEVLKYIYENEEESRKSFFKTDGTLANGTIC